MITLDTSALITLLNTRDPDYRRVVTALRADPGPYLVPAGALGELTYMVEARLGQAVLEDFLADFDAGAYSYDCGDKDLPRIRHLLNRYRDLRLGFVDAAVIACAERNRGRVLTLDLRDFGVVAQEGTITILPE